MSGAVLRNAGIAQSWSSSSVGNFRMSEHNEEDSVECLYLRVTVAK